MRRPKRRTKKVRKQEALSEQMLNLMMKDIDDSAFNKYADPSTWATMPEVKK